MSAESGWTVGLEEVVREEKEYVRERRTKAGLPAETPDGPVGLALSGGGIRSATFNLGLLQGLWESGLLKKVDYLSTVSGGGYIGSCLTSLLTERDARPGLRERPFDVEGDFPLKPDPGNDRIQHLRHSSNYLAPRHGLFALATWRLVAAYLRGLILTLLTFLPALAAGVLALRWLATKFGFVFLTPLQRLSDLHATNPAGWLTSMGSFIERRPAAVGLLGLAALAAAGFIALTLLSGAFWRLFRRASRQRLLESVMGGLLMLIVGVTALAILVWGARTAGIDPTRFYVFFWCLIATVVFGYLFDWNHSSLHRFYRARLAEAYLRTLVTGDDGKRRTLRDDERLLLSEACRGRRGPYHLIQTTLNLPGTTDPRREGRGADFFLLSPFYCGSATTRYVRTERFEHGQVSLGTALAISGAAVSPQRGQSTSRTMAFLQTFLNLRLGYWAPNPLHWTSRVLSVTPRDLRGWARHLAARTARFWPLYALMDLFSWANEDAALVMLSDGGHHENLGLYALLQRRCRYVVVSDAGADPTFAFEDLGNVIRKARIDLGVEIKIDTKKIRPNSKTGRSVDHVARGEIIYPGEEDRPATLVYVKASVVGHEPPDVLHYKTTHPAFPHEPTSDQFFDEAQFESYRVLGREIALEVFEEEGMER